MSRGATSAGVRAITGKNLCSSLDVNLKEVFDFKFIFFHSRCLKRSL